MIDVRRSALDGVVEITPSRHGDSRGYLSETYKASVWREAGVALDVVQDNEAHSARALTLRGLHFQRPPYAQDKLVRVARGRVWDVVVDLRQGSPTYRAWEGVELSAAKGNQLLAPKGFAHGFLTLEPDCLVLYKMTAEYAPAHERAVRWDDPALGVDWPLGGAQPVLSEKDAVAPLLADLGAPFADVEAAER